MANYYDITIKGILKDNPNRFLNLLAGAHEGKIIELEFTETKLRKPDVVFELSDGSLLHLELQSSKKGVETMPVTVNMEEDIFYKEGIQKGRLEGIQKGRLEGKIEGILEGLQEALQLGLEIKYGKDALQLIPFVKQIRDIEKLKFLKEFLKQTQSLDDMTRQIEIVIKDKTSK